ncbi:MAG: aldo/keto reductase [Chloroflexota bacterium]
MEYKRLGKTGLKVSRLCLGMMSYGTSQWRDWVLDEPESREFIKAAIEAGINFFDTADWYATGVSEEVTGRALRDFARREDVIIGTKFFYPMSDDINDRGMSRHHIMNSVEKSLKRLGTDYIDLYIVHRLDPETPLEEMLEALNDLIRQGKVRYIGASQMEAWRFAKCLYLSELKGWSRFVSMQNHYNLIYREEEREMIPLCEEEGVGLTPYSPLARGFLAGSQKRFEEGTKRTQSDVFIDDYYFQGSDTAVVERVVQLAAKHDVSPAQIALAWILHQPTVTAPIVGATKMHHLTQAIDALNISLTAEELAYLEEPYVPHPVIGPER